MFPIIGHVLYISILMWGIGTCGQLQKFDSNAARVINGVSCDRDSILGWETLEKRRLRNNAVLMYKILIDHSAPNLKQLFMQKK